MSPTTLQIPISFDPLLDAAKHEVALEFLRRTRQFDFPPLTDEELMAKEPIVMPTIQIEADLSPEQLLSAARQLPRREFDRFVERVLSLRAERDAPVLSATESELLLKINHPVPDDVQRRYDELIVRRDARTLTPEEHEDLLRLTDQVELLEAERMRQLIELAQFRQIALDELMGQLGLQPPSNA